MSKFSQTARRRPGVGKEKGEQGKETGDKRGREFTAFTPLSSHLLQFLPLVFIQINVKTVINSHWRQTLRLPWSRFYCEGQTWSPLHLPLKTSRVCPATALATGVPILFSSSSAGRLWLTVNWGPMDWSRWILAAADWLKPFPCGFLSWEQF